MTKQSDRLDCFAPAALAMTFFISMLFLPGCATIAGSFNPQVITDQLAEESRLIKERVPTSVFTLTAYSRLENPGEPLTVYIEGDGRSWLSRTRLSEDPTPFHPIMIKLASMDGSPNVVYLARPCQYDNSASQKPCGPEYWSDKRFSVEVIDSMNEAVNFFAQKSKTSQVNLIGYSGGGAVAVLVASRRQDVASVRTIAGNLDPDSVNRHHKAGPLIGSLDPLSAAQSISHIPQRHFTGSGDTVVPPFIAEYYLRASGSDRCTQITNVPGVTHYSGWIEKWGELVKMPCHCEERSDEAISA